MSSGFDPVPSDRLEITSEVGAALTDFDYRVVASVLKMTHALRWPKDTLSYLTERIALEGFQIPVSQLSGFTQFNAQAAPSIETSETTTSTTFTNLDTVGPQLTGLPDGKYVIFWGCLAYTSIANFSPMMGIKINGTEATTAEICFTNTTQAVSVSFMATKTLSNAGNNTVTARYRVDDTATGTFGRRWLIVLKYASL